MAQKADAIGRLTVELIDASAQPYTGRATVVVGSIDGGDELKAAGRAGEATRFVFELPAGRYAVEVRARRVEAERLTVALGRGEHVRRRVVVRAEQDIRDEGDGQLIDGRRDAFVSRRVTGRDEFPADARERALAHKAKMLDPDVLNAPLEVSTAPSPIPHGSFGSVEWVRVKIRRGQGGFGRRLLAIPYDRELLGWVDATTLRVFSVGRKNRLRLITDSGADPERGFAWAYIDAPGVYGVIGLPGDPGVRQVVEAACRVGHGAGDPKSARALLDRLCKALICGDDQQAGLTPPGGIEGGACEFCNSVEVPEGGLPECQILGGPPDKPDDGPGKGGGEPGGPFGPPAPSGPCQWLSIGPRNINGRIRALAAHPNTGGVLYAGSGNGGVWKTEDSGQTWAPLMFQEGALEIGALAVHLTDPGNPAGPVTIYAGTGEGTSWPGYKGVGVLKSTAGGAPGSWTATGAFPAAQGDRFNAIAVDPTTVTSDPATTTVWAGGPGGLFKSTDAGATWNAVLIDGVTKSIEDIALDPVNPAIVYAAVTFQGVFRFDPGTMTWSAFNANFAALPQLIRLAIGKSAPHKMYAKLDQTVYRFDTGTNQWTSLGDHGGTTYGYWNIAIAVDPEDSDIVVAAGFAVERSFDAGSNWQTPGVGHEDQHAVAFDAGNHLTVWAGNDGGVFRGTYTSASDTGTWTKRSYGLTISHLNSIGQAPGPGRALVGSGVQDNGSIRTTGALTWDHVLGGDGSDFAIDPGNPLVVYAQLTTVGVNGRPYKSTNGGQSFAPANSGFPDGQFVGKMVLDPNSAADPNRVLFAAGNDQCVYRTADSAGSWSASSPSLGAVADALAVAPSSSAVVYAGTSNGGVWRSSDGGASVAGWTNITGGTAPGSATLPNRAISDIAVHPTDPNTLFVAFSGVAPGMGQHVYQGTSADGFATWGWTDISSNLPNIPANALEVHRTTPATMWAGTDTAMFQTTNGGMSWAPFDEGMPNVVITDLKLNAPGDTLRAAAYGYSAWERRIDGACPTVDIYVRDNKLDVGQPPPPSGVPDPTTPGANVWWWESADVKIDTFPYLPAPTDGVEFDQLVHENPVVNDAAHPDPNKLYVQVTNRGPQVAHNVKVKALWADASLAVPPLPSDFWAQFPNTWTAVSPWSEVDTSVPFRPIAALAPHTPAIVSWEWAIPDTAAQHTCMVVVISSDEDSTSRSDAGVNDHNLGIVAPGDKYVAQKNLTVLNTTGAPPGGGGGTGEGGVPLGVALTLHNPSERPHFFDILFDRGNLPRRARVSLLLPAVKTRGELGGEVPVASIQPGRGWWRKARLRVRGFKHELRLSAAAPHATGTPGAAVEVPGVLIPVGKPLHAALVVDPGPGGKPGTTYRCSILQRQGRVVVGGNTIELRVPPREVVVRAG